jgi:hypothetical protein
LVKVAVLLYRCDAVGRRTRIFHRPSLAGNFIRDRNALDPLQEEVKFGPNALQSLEEMRPRLIIARMNDEGGFVGLNGLRLLLEPDGDNVPGRAGCAARPFGVIAIKLKLVAVGVDFDSIGDLEHGLKPDAEVAQRAAFRFFGRANPTDCSEIELVERTPVVNELQSLLIDADGDFPFAGQALTSVLGVLNKFEDEPRTSGENNLRN